MYYMNIEANVEWSWGIALPLIAIVVLISGLISIFTKYAFSSMMGSDMMESTKALLSASE